MAGTSKTSGEATSAFIRLRNALINGSSIKPEEFRAFGLVGVFGGKGQSVDLTLLTNPQAHAPFKGFERLTMLEYYRRLIDDFEKSLPNKDRPAFVKSAYWPEGLHRDGEEDKLNATDIRRVWRELSKFWLERDMESWLNKLWNPQIMREKDARTVSDFNTMDQAQAGFRRFLGNPQKFEDYANLGLYGEWKFPWGGLQTYLDDLKTIIEKSDGFRAVQQASRHVKLAEEAAKARAGTRQFDRREVAVQNPAFDLAAEVGDLFEYVHLSPNYNRKTGWVSIPGSVEPDQKRVIESRISRLTRDGLTREVVAHLHSLHPSYQKIDARQIAELRELFFPSVELVSSKAHKWVIKWSEAWDNWTYGQILIDKIESPYGKQYLTWAVSGVDAATRKLAEERPSGGFIGPKPSGIVPRWITLLIVLPAAVLFGVFSMKLTGHPNILYALIFGIVLMVILNGYFGYAISKHSPVPYWIGVLALVLVLAAFILVYPSFYAQSQSNLTQNYVQRFPNDQNFLH